MATASVAAPLYAGMMTLIGTSRLPDLEVHVEISSGIPRRGAGPTPGILLKRHCVPKKSRISEMVAVLMGRRGPHRPLQGFWQGVRLSCRGPCTKGLWIDRRLAQPPLQRHRGLPPGFRPLDWDSLHGGGRQTPRKGWDPFFPPRLRPPTQHSQRPLASAIWKFVSAFALTFTPKVRHLEK
jgi:hypothetical protein